MHCRKGQNGWKNTKYLKFIFSKKATKIEVIFTADLTATTYCQIDGEDFVNFCGLLRKHELYQCTVLKDKPQEFAKTYNKKIKLIESEKELSHVSSRSKY